MPEKWRFFRAQMRHFAVLGAGSARHRSLILPLLYRPTFLSPESGKNVGRHFLGDDFVDVTRRGRVRPDATNRGTRGRHKDAAQTATLPLRAVSLYLDASVYAGLRQHNRATH